MESSGKPHSSARTALLISSVANSKYPFSFKTSLSLESAEKSIRLDLSIPSPLISDEDGETLWSGSDEEERIDENDSDKDFQKSFIPFMKEERNEREFRYLNLENQGRVDGSKQTAIAGH